MNLLWFFAGFVVGLGAGALAIYVYIRYAMKKVMKSFEGIDVLMNMLKEHEKKRK